MRGDNTGQGRGGGDRERIAEENKDESSRAGEVEKGTPQMTVTTGFERGGSDEIWT